MALPIKGEYPNVSRALRGWTRRRAVQVVTQTIVNGLSQYTALTYRLHIAIQPMPEREVDRKREDQQSWGWWSIWIKSSNIELNIDDAIVVDGKPYLISKIGDWSGGGYRKYEAHENWQGELPAPPGALTYNGVSVTYQGEQVYA